MEHFQKFISKDYFIIFVTMGTFQLNIVPLFGEFCWEQECLSTKKVRTLALAVGPSRNYKMAIALLWTDAPPPGIC